MSSARILESSVWRGMPSFTPAPLGPAIRPSHSRRALSMAARYAPCVETPPALRLSQDGSIEKVSPSHSTTARSMTFCSSPGGTWAA